ncbi:unnamed protein product [Rhodiola kirilowii]
MQKSIFEEAEEEQSPSYRCTKKYPSFKVILNFNNYYIYSAHTLGPAPSTHAPQACSEPSASGDVVLQQLRPRHLRNLDVLPPPRRHFLQQLLV